MKFFKYTLVFAAGAGLSFVVTRYILKEKYEKLAQDEIDDVKNYYRDQIKQVEENAAREIRNMVTQLNEGKTEETVETEVVSGEDDDEEDTEVVEKKQKNEYAKKTTDYSAMFKQDKKPEVNIQYDLAEKEYPSEEEDEESEAEMDSKHKTEVIYEDPYVISYEEYTNENTHYDKITLTYYSEDDVLVDENEDHISDVDYLVGDDALLKFGVGNDDPDIVYVRNEKLSTDYEIIRIFRSYSRDVLGIDEERIRPSKSAKKRRLIDEE